MKFTSILELFRKSISARPKTCVIALTPILILMGCSGGGGGGGTPTSLVAATIGKVCMAADNSYSVDISGSSPQNVQLDADPLSAGYQGSMGGQIRGIASMNLAAAGEDAVEMLVWGSGAAVKYGTTDTVVGTVILSKPGAVTDLAPINVGGNPMIVYGTERGIGLIGADSSGKLADLAGSGAWRSVPYGVISITASADGSSIIFASGDGYLQQISESQLAGGEKCAGVVAKGIAPASASEAFSPVKAVIGGNQVFVMSRAASAMTSTAPTFEQAYDPIFSAMVNDVPVTTVASIPLSGGSASLVGFDAADKSFSGYDRFIPTDIASDGTNVYVVGVAYTQQSVSDFISAKCTGEQASNPAACLRDAAKKGTLTSYTDSTGLYKFNAGFFVYRKTDDLSKADHFTSIQLTTFTANENAPPYTYVIGTAGEQVFVRGPNFLISMAKNATTSGAEDWKYGAVADSKAGLIAGLPNRVVTYQGGAVASFTAVRAADGTGASALEVMGADLSFKVIDTGAIYMRVEGAGMISNKALVAAIEMASYRGGKLYIENSVERHSIDISFKNPFVSHAAYDGSKLAFAWSSTGDSSSPERDQTWRLDVQDGFDSSTRGEKVISRTSQKEFKDFPAIDAGETDPSIRRGIGGMMFSPDSTLTVLYTGFSSKEGSWSQLVAIYPITKPSGKYLIGDASLIMNTTLKTTGTAAANAGKLLLVAKDGANYEVIFSGPGGVYSWKSNEATATTVFGTSNIVDAAVNAQGGSKLAMLDGDKIVLKDLSNRSSAGTSLQVQRKPGSQLTRLTSAQIALNGNGIALASPYGAAATFSTYSISSGTPVLVAGTTLSRYFDVKAFAAIPKYLLVSSQASGIEIYSFGE